MTGEFTALLGLDPEDWEWSSARHHLGMTANPLISPDDLLPKLVDNWETHLATPATETEQLQLRRHERTGRPLGDLNFLKQLEQRLNRTLTPQKRGPKGPWKHKKTKGGKD